MFCNFVAFEEAKSDAGQYFTIADCLSAAISEGSKLFGFV